MKNLPIEPRIIANSRPIQLHSFAQGKTAILLKRIYNFNTIDVLVASPALLLPLSQHSDGITYSVSCAAMSCPGISNKEQYRSHLTIQRSFPLYQTQKQMGG